MNPRLQHVGLSLARRPRRLRDVRLHNGSPAEHTNVLSSDHIGWPSEATRCADKRGLGCAVFFRGMPTRGAGARGIPRVNKMDRYPLQRRLIDDIGLQL